MKLAVLLLFDKIQLNAKISIASPEKLGAI